MGATLAGRVFSPVSAGPDILNRVVCYHWQKYSNTNQQTTRAVWSGDVPVLRKRGWKTKQYLPLNSRGGF